MNVSLFCLTRRVLPRHSVITHRFRSYEDEEPDFESAGPATPVAAAPAGSYLAETDAYGDEKVFKRVASPDADSLSDTDSDDAHGPLPPPLAIVADAGARSPEMFARVSLDSPRPRAQFPASGGGAMAYPQSPLSAGGRGAVSPPLRSAALRSNLGIQ